MAFLVQHGKSRAAAAAAPASRERKPRHGLRAAARSPDKPELGRRQLAGRLLLAACPGLKKPLGTGYRSNRSGPVLDPGGFKPG